LNNKQETVIIKKEELDSKLLKLENYFDACVTLLEKRIKNLTCELEVARNKQDELVECLTKIESQTLRTNNIHKQLALIESSSAVCSS